MERTYNDFVDNGAYVLSYYLEKDIELITDEDIKNSSDLFSGLFAKFLGSNGKDQKKNYLATHSYTSFMNSFLTQIWAKDKGSEKSFDDKKNYIKPYLDELVAIPENIKLLKCDICGKRKVILNNKNVNKKYMPGIPASTFTNSYNNMQSITICPHCMYLSILSSLNVISTTYGICMVNSDSDKYMKEVTENIQLNLQNTILIPYQSINQEKYMYLIMTSKNKEKRLKDGNYINIVNFKNGKENKYEVNTIDIKCIEYLKKIKFLGISHDLYKFGNILNYINSNTVSNLILNRIINKNIEIINKDTKIINKKKTYIDIEKLEEIYDFVGGCEMGENIKIIRDIINKLRSSYDNSKVEHKLNAIKDIKTFRDFMINEINATGLIIEPETYELLENMWSKVVTYLKLTNAVENNKSKLSI